jgi:predicted glycoside hydrolase/deacetylase ChbG (UPF0249 family)
MGRDNYSLPSIFQKGTVMKLLVQSDDYGITKGAAHGTLEAIEYGIVKNTGLFSNMSWAEECAAWIRPYLDRIAFGLDLNMSTGPSICAHQVIPGLVQENGMFLTSGMNRALDTDENGHDHCAAIKDQIEMEFEKQIERYISIVGKTPDYLHAHAYGTETTAEVSRELAKKYGIHYSMDLPSEMTDMKMAGFGWYKFPPTFENQIQDDPIQYITEDRDGLLEHQYGYIITHCGYCDAPLVEMSSFNLNRVKDLEAMTSPVVKKWVEENRVELISYKDLK